MTKVTHPEFFLCISRGIKLGVDFDRVLRQSDVQLEKRRRGFFHEETQKTYRERRGNGRVIG